MPNHGDEEEQPRKNTRVAEAANDRPQTMRSATESQDKLSPATPVYCMHALFPCRACANRCTKKAHSPSLFSRIRAKNKMALCSPPKLNKSHSSTSTSKAKHIGLEGDNQRHLPSHVIPFALRRSSAEAKPWRPPVVVRRNIRSRSWSVLLIWIVETVLASCAVMPWSKAVEIKVAYGVLLVDLSIILHRTPSVVVDDVARRGRGEAYGEEHKKEPRLCSSQINTDTESRLNAFLLNPKCGARFESLRLTTIQFRKWGTSTRQQTHKGPIRLTPLIWPCRRCQHTLHFAAAAAFA